MMLRPFRRPQKQFLAGPITAFTLPNLMVSMSLFLLVMTGLLSTHLCGLRLMEFSKARTGASGYGAQKLDSIISEIRKAHLVRLGTGDAFSFTEIGEDQLQRGNAVLVQTTASPEEAIRYFLDTSDQILKRVDENGNVSELLQAISNENPFQFEDFTGQILTNKQALCILGVRLQFSAIHGLEVSVGSGQYYESYQLNSKLACRSFETP